MGINLFVLQSVAQASMGTIVRGIAPLVAADRVRLVIIAEVRGLARWLPSLM